MLVVSVCTLSTMMRAVLLFRTGTCCVTMVLAVSLASCGLLVGTLGTVESTVGNYATVCR